MTELEEKFVEKWKKEIISIGGKEDVLNEIIKKSGSPYIQDHLHAWLNSLITIKNQESILNKLGKYLEDVVNLENKLHPEKVKKNEIPRKLEAAINLYEKNLENNFEGNFPYDRLIVIYKKYKLHDDLLRIINKAIYVFENIVNKHRGDRLPKLNKYKKQLEKLK